MAADQEAGRPRIDCTRCRHYWITWDANFPRGCRVLNFKTRMMPSQEVLAASGKECLAFEPKSGGGGSSSSGSADKPLWRA
ncbi:MAG: uracil-DNA glycosylase [Magnetococcales bacterium]|nr:uracil-DNA glycosylase [Magnetococcales bacterium]